MTAVTFGTEQVEAERLALVREAAKDDPKALIAEMQGFDPTFQEHFSFTMYDPDDDPHWPYPEPRGDIGWYWQAEIIDWWMDPELRKFLVLKARQLGVTWLAVALGIWFMLYRPGSTILIYSIGEDESKEAIARAWSIFELIPESLRDHMEVLTPQKAEIPTEWIRLRDKATGKVSRMRAMPATKKAGRSATATLIISDEMAFQDYARQIYQAANPAISRGGRFLGISTANGVSNLETGAGNFFHHLWVTAKSKNLESRFLPWHMHPERGDNGEPVEGSPPRMPVEGGRRDPNWYAREAMSQTEVERNMEYPLTEDDAFMLSGEAYFHRADLDYYKLNIAKPILRGVFLPMSLTNARWVNDPKGWIEVYDKPSSEGAYAISADVATGKGMDYSVFDVIDLSDGAVVCHGRSKIEVPRLAEQLYWIGRWYNTARIGPERAGGYGEALVISLRDGTVGRPPYPSIYRHTDTTKTKRPTAESYGFPMTLSTRPMVLEYLKSCLRDRLWPYLPAQTVWELQTFVHRDTTPSPRAQEGSFDDCVMSLGIGAQLFQRLGSPPGSKKARARTGQIKKQKYQPHPSRQTL